MNSEPMTMRELTASDAAAVSGGTSGEEFLASAATGAASGAAIGASIGFGFGVPIGAAYGAAVGGFVGGFWGGVQYAAGELFDYCF